MTVSLAPGSIRETRPWHVTPDLPCLFRLNPEQKQQFLYKEKGEKWQILEWAEELAVSHTTPVWKSCFLDTCLSYNPLVTNKQRPEVNTGSLVWETETSRAGIDSGTLAGIANSEASVALMCTLTLDLPGFIRWSNSHCMDQRLPLGCYLWHILYDALRSGSKIHGPATAQADALWTKLLDFSSNRPEPLTVSIVIYSYIPTNIWQQILGVAGLNVKSSLLFDEWPG